MVTNSQAWPSSTPVPAPKIHSPAIHKTVTWSHGLSLGLWISPFDSKAILGKLCFRKANKKRDPWLLRAMSEGMEVASTATGNSCGTLAAAARGRSAQGLSARAPCGLQAAQHLRVTFAFVFVFYFYFLRERGRERTCCSTYLCIHWLLLVCALTRDGTCNLGAILQPTKLLLFFNDETGHAFLTSCIPTSSTIPAETVNI